ncbi:MAG: ABC transporter permease, partial [Phycisphaerales bacterium]
MNDVLYMAWRYVRFHWGKTVLLVSAISLVLFVPAGLHVVVEQGAQTLTARAESTPLLIGAKGSAVDLTLSALYFRPPNLSSAKFREVHRVHGTGLGLGIPLHLRYTVRRQRIVGTTMDYAEFRSLAVAEGRWFGLLGECVLGAEAARALGVGVGEYVLSSAGSAFDVAGAFPLKMPVVGVLKPTGTVDDEAVFVDVKTTWVISGLAHGHDNVNTAREGDKGVLEREESNVVANATVLSYTEITQQNIDSFHFHGDPDSFPVDAILAVPTDRKSGILLRGRYEEEGTTVQMLVPSRVVNEVLETMFSVRNYVILGSIGVGVATLMTAALVFALSIRLRRREIETIRKIGGASRRLRGMLASEILLVVFGGVVIAGVLTVGVSRYGDVLVHFIGS